MGMLLRRHEGYGKNITKTSDIAPVAESKKADEKKATKKEDKKAK
jgi:hypothetical protein